VTAPDITEFPAAASTAVAGAMVVGGSWEDEPATTPDAPAFPDPFAD
jgi:hypothetical protein